jgi:hypothetical protein
MNESFVDEGHMKDIFIWFSIWMSTALLKTISNFDQFGS